MKEPHTAHMHTDWQTQDGNFANQTWRLFLNQHYPGTISSYCSLLNLVKGIWPLRMKLYTSSENIPEARYLYLVHWTHGIWTDLMLHGKCCIEHLRFTSKGGWPCPWRAHSLARGGNNHRAEEWGCPIPKEIMMVKDKIGEVRESRPVAQTV